MFLLAGAFNWKVVILVLGGIVLLVGICTGSKGKAHDSKHYDAKEKRKIDHGFRMAEGGKDYVYKGSGMYRDSSGRVKKEK